jgi:Flp pilus assembly pilin Flp
MTKIFNRIRTFSIKEEGAALVEYGIILGLIVAVGATALTALGNNTDAAIVAACESLEAGVSGKPGAVTCPAP